MKLKNEHPPAMHSAMGWCKHGYINQMLNWPHTGFKALRAGRTPACHASQTTMADQCHLADTRRYFAKTTQGHCGQVERPTSNVEWEKMKKQTYVLEKGCSRFGARMIQAKSSLPRHPVGSSCGVVARRAKSQAESEA